MSWIITDEDTVIRFPEPKLTVERKKEIGAKVVDMFTRAPVQIGHKLCAHCRKQMIGQESIFCMPCQHLFAARAADEAVHAENRKTLKTAAAAVAVGGAVITAMIYFFGIF